MDTALIGKVVTIQKFVENLARYGFKYSNMRNSLVLIYPSLPKKFKEYKMEIMLGPRNTSNLAQITDVKFMKMGNPSYKETNSPDPEFGKYVSGFVQEAFRRSMPMHVIQPW